MRCAHSDIFVGKIATDHHPRAISLTLRVLRLTKHAKLSANLNSKTRNGKIET